MEKTSRSGPGSDIRVFHFRDGGGLKNGYIIPGTDTDTAEEAISKRCRDRERKNGERGGERGGEGGSLDI